MSNISSFPTAIPDGDDLILGSQIDVAGIPSTKNFTVQSIVDLAPGGGGGGSYLPLAGGTMTGNTIHNDNVKSVYGTGNDLQIYNSGNNSYIQNIGGAVGDLFIDNLVDDKDIILRSDNGAGSITNYIVCDGSNGSVSLNHYGNLKLETTTSGVGVTGDISAVGGSFTGLVTMTNRLDLNDAFDNTFIGSSVGVNNTTGGANVSAGYNALSSNTTGSQNVAIGYTSLEKNTEGNYNTAVGLQSLKLNTTGTFNLAVGYQSLTKNISGDYNSALGHTSLYNNTTGTFNVGIGSSSLINNTTGNYNIGLGRQSLQANTSGSNNIGIGYNSFHTNTTGTLNIGIGYRAGSYITDGSTSNDASTYSVFLGVDSMANSTGETNQIVIGYQTTGNGSNTVTLGNTDIVNTYLNGAVTSSGSITANGTLLTGAPDLTSYLLNTTDTFTGDLTLTGKLVLGDALDNNFIGEGSGRVNTTGDKNVALGYQSLYYSTTGANNVASGYQSLHFNTTGSLNIGIGYRAGSFITGGSSFNEASSNSIFIGSDTKANADGQTNQIVIGTDAIGAGSNTVTLGNDNITNTYLKGDVTVAGNLIGGLPYTSLVQLLNQTGTAAPVATEVYNNTGQTFTWSYVSNGIYRITATGTPFAIGKTVVLLNSGNNGSGVWYDPRWSRISDTIIEVTSTDNSITNGSFEIKIYN